jgi:predicted component of type VI protein secretion system
VAANIWLTFPNGSEYELKDSISIGREPSNDLVMESAAVSRDHATLSFRDGRWYIEDRGSFNGTFLNGTRVVPGTPLPLRHADRISIGAETLIFSWPAQMNDPDTTEPAEEMPTGNGAQLSSFQRQVVQALCGPWLAGSSLEKAALRRIYAKAGLSNEPAHAKRRALCRVARQNGWI